MNKIPVAVLGATGAVGQRFVQLLENHPWFRVAALSASEQRVGQRYGASCRWVLDGDMPASVRDLPLLPPTAEALNCRLAFSALPSNVAGPIEEELARAGLVVCSNASSHRMDEDVPLIIPEINADHLDLIAVQQRRRSWPGLLVTNSNCTSMPVVIALKPLMDSFGVRAAHVVSLQALSGAGYPGLPSLDMLDNILPYVSGEEPKLETEPLKMLGRLRGERVEPAAITLSAQCNRVAVRDGHIVCLSIALERKAAPAEVKEALRTYRGAVAQLRLPSAPDPLIVVREEDDRPQPRRDRDAGAGMAVVVGRVQRCPVFDIKLVALSHNTIRGAAGGSILNAELLVARGLLEVPR
ncbi:MAG: aspartate-semialdehyde dehydrogenase [Anaerolineae bacterium]